MKKCIKSINIVFLIILVMFQAACAASPAISPASSPANIPPAGPTGSLPPPATQPVSAQPDKTPNPPPPTASNSIPPMAQLSLAIIDPLDESVVGTSNVVISGQTAPEAVVSVNGEVVDVDASGKFAAPVTLDEGPNTFDIIATDLDGNEAAKQIVISYDPLS